MTRLLRTRALVPLAVALLILAGGVLTQSWAATFVVTSNADSDDGVCDGVNCTLREAINAANAAPGADRIEFNIGSGTPAIQLLSQLPVLTDSVTIDGATGGATRVELDGLNAAGLADGLHATSSNNTVKSLVINNFRGDGIELNGAGGNRIEDCFIGCDASGTSAKPNGFAGITLTSDSNNTIVNNVLSGNTNAGVVAYSSSGNVIKGNLIGINASGTAVLGNQDGVILINSSVNVIGGAAPGDANIIGGHSSDGIEMDGAASTGNRVQGNYIGTNSGWANFGNLDDGVEINLGASNNTIGGANPSEGNVIANCGGNGVEVASSCTGNAVLGNSISACGVLGIDLAPIGVVNTNDVQDPDTGANLRQNYPVIASAAAGLGGTTVAGSLNSKPLETYRIELFASDECSLLGAGFGKTFLGSVALTTDANGDASFAEIVAGGPPAGSVITATATDAGGNTSEFSLCRAVEKVIRVGNAATRDPAMVEFSKSHQFTVWGTVTTLDADSFTVDDGSGSPVKVLATGHGVQSGEFARAEGLLDVTGDPSVLSSAVSKIERISDFVPPHVAISNPSADKTRTGPVDYVVTYTDADTITLSDADVTLIKTGSADGTFAVLPDGPDTRIVRISGTSGDGTLTISIAPGTAQDTAGNLAGPAGPATGFEVDNTPPAVSIQGPSEPTTSSGPIEYVVVYELASSITLGAADITLNSTGTATGTVSVSGSSPVARTVTISDISGNGTLSIAVAAGTAVDTVGNVAAGAGPSNTVEVANGPATIAIGDPSPASTSSGPVVFPVHYTLASSVTLSASDVTLHKTGTADGSVSVAGSGTTEREVVISGITGNGSLAISIAAGTASGAGGAAPAAGPSAAAAVDNVAPTISVGPPSLTLTNVGPVTFTVTYGGADSITLGPPDVILNKTGTADATVGISGSGNTRTVTLSPVTGNGTIGIQIAAGSAADTAGNLAPASSATATFNVDNTPPVITISNPSKAVTSAGPVTYTLGYSGYSSMTLTQADITLNKTGTADGTATLSGSGSVRTVTVSGVSGDGTLSISVAAGTAVDPAGNLAPAAGPSVVFTVDNTPPTISLTGPSVASTVTGPVDYRVTYGGFSSISLSTANITLNKTGTANGSMTVLWASTTERIVRLSGITGNGTLGITIAPGTAIDSVSLTAPGAGPSATVIVGSGDP